MVGAAEGIVERQRHGLEAIGLLCKRYARIRADEVDPNEVQCLFGYLGEFLKGSAEELTGGLNQLRWAQGKLSDDDREGA